MSQAKTPLQDVQCFRDHPTFQPQPSGPDPDISGTGVIVGYVATAGIVTLIVLVHYVWFYEPVKGSLRGDSDRRKSLKFSTRSVDEYTLALLRRWGRIDYTPNKRQRVGWIKCVLAMSDLQILTGLSIMISGLANLRYGLTCLNLQLIIYLAWFSTLTHLVCLTFLREYLRERPPQLAWRMFAMGALVCMLIIALVPLPSCYQFDLRTTPAICQFRAVTREGSDNRIASTVLSGTFLVLAFVIRLLRLSKSTSSHLHQRIWLPLCRKELQWLEKAGWGESSQEQSYAAKLLMYRPLLSLIVYVKAVLDILSSMLLEVWWLLCAFIWGLINLISTRNQLTEYPSAGPSASDTPWTFGQIVPLVMLGAPFTAVSEYLTDVFCDTSEATSQGSVDAVTSRISSGSMTEAANEDENIDDATHVEDMTSSILIERAQISSAFGHRLVAHAPSNAFIDKPYRKLVLFLALYIFYLTIMALLSTGWALFPVPDRNNETSSLVDFLLGVFLPQVWIERWAPLRILLSCIVYFSNTLLIDDLWYGKLRLRNERGRRVGARVSDFVNFLLLLTSQVDTFYEAFDDFMFLGFVAASLVTAVSLSLTDWLRQRKERRQRQSNPREGN